MNYAVYLSGKEIKDSAFLEDFADREVNVFETLRTYGGSFFRLQDHLKRLEESAKSSGFTSSLNLKLLERELKQSVKDYLRKNQSGRPGNLFVRITFHHGEAFVMIGQRKHPETLYRRGITLRTSPVKRSLSHAAFPEAKTAAYQNAVMASLEPGEGIYERLFLDAQGFITEVRIGNLFIIKAFSKQKDPELLTPPTTGILNGVTRRFVIKCALQAGIRVKETPLTRHDLFNADEAFLTNTSWEILPVAELDGRQIGKKIPGPYTLCLQKHFRATVKKECP